ncbi:MAG: protein kinase [Planctomycetes bacterium]|nr:protein kinase [Planctomycetota bacterium]
MTETDTSADTSRQAEDLTGKEVAGCKIISKLGEGAMGMVYLAEQTNLQVQVAVKVLHPRFARDQVYIERFEREAQACARLGHFNVVQVYDFGRSGETYHIVSEYVDGDTLQDVLDKGNLLSCIDATDLVLQTAQGLAAAQEAGIVHRDIKPANLMLTSARKVKITDFGLAKAPEESNAGLTQAGMVVGTPFYMSPEQAHGNALDGRTDIYSLGATFYHLVTGQPPFDGDSTLAVLMKHISSERPDPSAINPAVPATVSKVIMKMMARERDNRYSSAVEVIPVLRDLLDKLKRDAAEGQPVIASPAIDPERAGRYKLLPSSMISQIVPLEVTADALARMQASCQSDSGVFIESNLIYPEGTLLQVRFNVPGRDEVEGIGLVRWTNPQGPQAGMGITFLKMQPVRSSQVRASESVIARRANLPIKEILAQLTLTQLHKQLFKYYYANLDHPLKVRNISDALGVGPRMITSKLDEYKALGLAVDRGKDTIIFLWPDDQELQNAIMDWIQKFGLT